MITKNKKFLFMVFSLFLISLTSVQSITFGTVPKNDYTEIRQGETAEFTILLWNTGNSPYNVKIQPELLEDWQVIVRPENIYLEPSEKWDYSSGDGEYISLPYTDGYVKATPIKILIKTPTSVELGEYTIRVTATAGNLGEQISVLQEREFNLRVKILRNPTIFEKTAKALKVIGKKTVDNVKEQAKIATGKFLDITKNISQRINTILLVVVIGSITIIVIRRKTKSK